MSTPKNNSSRITLLAFSGICAFIGLICFGALVPNIDPPAEPVSKPLAAIGFVLFSCAALSLYQMAVGISTRRIIAEGLLMFAVLSASGLAFAS